MIAPRAGTTHPYIRKQFANANMCTASVGVYQKVKIFF